jgi:hypothetical protein
MSDLTIYLITRDSDERTWDEYWGHVIAATDENDARALAAVSHADESHDEWWQQATVRALGQANGGVEAGIVLSDFHAG